MPTPPDGPDVVYEFFAPFAHVEGRYEWCRIRSPTHGVFDTFILISESPVVVYVNGLPGERFMADRYPESRCYRVAASALKITETDAGRTVKGTLTSDVGPMRRAVISIRARRDARPRNVPYGGVDEPVWGSRRWTCWGVDLVLDAEADGTIEWRDRPAERLAKEAALLTLGSFGRIAPLPSKRPAKPRPLRVAAP